MKLVALLFCILSLAKQAMWLYFTHGAFTQPLVILQSRRAFDLWETQQSDTGRTDSSPGSRLKLPMTLMFERQPRLREATLTPGASAELTTQATDILIHGSKGKVKMNHQPSSQKAPGFDRPPQPGRRRP